MSKNAEFPPKNGAVLQNAQIIKTVMTSAAKAEIVAMFINARKSVPDRKTLQEMGNRRKLTLM